MSEVKNATVGNCKVPGRGCLMVLGVFNVILGFVAIGSPWMAGTAAVIIIGSMLIISGIFEMVHVFSVHGGKNRLVLFIGGLLGLIGGGIILARPLLGLATLTLVLAMYFVVDGIMRIVGAFKLRPSSGWGWLLINGVITFALGGLIWRSWPLSGVWAIGTLVGVRILMVGFGILFMGPAVNAAVNEACNDGKNA